MTGNKNAQPANSMLRTSPGSHCCPVALQITRRLHFERVRARLADNLLLRRSGFAQPLAKIRSCVDKIRDVPMLALTPRLQASAGVAQQTPIAAQAMQFCKARSKRASTQAWLLLSLQLELISLLTSRVGCLDPPAVTHSRHALPCMGHTLKLSLSPASPAGGVSGVWLLEEFADLQNTVRESQCRPALQGILDDISQVSWRASAVSASHSIHSFAWAAKHLLVHVQEHLPQLLARSHQVLLTHGCCSAELMWR